MTAKSQKEKPAYRQEDFDSHVLDREDAMQRLRVQWFALTQLEWPQTLDNHEALRKAIGEIDGDLIRYAIGKLKADLEEAATQDAGRLIAEQVLDTTENQDSIQRWEAWLDAAPCWAALARENWAEAVRLAASVVVETLSDAGVQLNGKAEAELKAQVGRLEIEDLLPKATIERLFPANLDPREW